MGPKQKLLIWLWSGIGLYACALLWTPYVERPAVDVLGHSEGDGLSVEEVVSQNRTRLLHVSASAAPDDTPPEAKPLLPDLVAHPPSDVGLVGSREAGTLRLKFTTRFSNQGEGPLEVRPEGESGGGERLRQVVYSADPDAPLQEHGEVGRYAFEQSHGHLHIETFAHYEIWSVDERGDLREPLVSNPKVGFCLIDAEIAEPEVTSKEMQTYWGCRSEVQGLSPGWGDVYTAQLAIQDLNVSDLPDGRYALVNAINHLERLLESDYTNNRAWVYLNITGGTVGLE